uniref:Reverse transcriptase zinc-binding domain-containing protein n=1 Tax=Setaria italica TaxID=4555 RepID=K3ZZP0_SETIT
MAPPTSYTAGCRDAVHRRLPRRRRRGAEKQDAVGGCKDDGDEGHAARHPVVQVSSTIDSRSRAAGHRNSIDPTRPVGPTATCTLTKKGMGEGERARRGHGKLQRNCAVVWSPCTGFRLSLHREYFGATALAATGSLLHRRALLGFLHETWKAVTVRSTARRAPRDFLFRHGGLGVRVCPFCADAPEDVEHLFFACPQLQAFWVVQCLPLPPGPARHTAVLLFLWVIWKSRNKMVFDAVAQPVACTATAASEHAALWIHRAPPAR